MKRRASTRSGSVTSTVVSEAEKPQKRARRPPSTATVASEVEKPQKRVRRPPSTATLASEAEKPPKRARVSIQPFGQDYPKAGATLYGSKSLDEDDEEDTFGLGKLMMKNVADVKATSEDIIVLKKPGKVFVLTPDLEGDGEEFNVRELKLPSKVVQIAAGIEHAACLLDDGRVFMWGSFENPGYMFKEQFIPVEILKTERIVQIASGRDHFLALNDRGHIYSMGSGFYGQLGRVTARSATGEGRRGVKVLFQPSRVHVHNKHIADRIWATQFGSFYRDFRTGAIFGCGKNTNQEVAPAKAADMKQTFIYKPVLSKFHAMTDMGHELVLTEFGAVFARPLVEEIAEDPKEWKSVKQAKHITSIQHDHGNTFLYDTHGGAFAWTRLGNRLTPVVPVDEFNDPVKIHRVLKMRNKYFFLIA